ncbi:MAG: glycosyltransferase family 39 protein [Acidimicrobiia bacterium]
MVALFVQFLVLGLLEAARDAVTIDEARYLASGLAALDHQQLAGNPHPVLSRVPAAVPALLARPAIPVMTVEDMTDDAGFGQRFVELNRENGRLDDAVLLARLVPLAEMVIAGGLLLRAVSRRFGANAGMAAVAVWSTSPFVLGMGHLAVTDGPFVLASLVVLTALDADRVRPTNRSAIVTGLAAGALVLTRHTGLAVVAVVAVAVARRRAGRRERAVAAAVVVITVWASVWGVYRTLDPNGPGRAAQARIDALVAGGREQSAAIRLLLAVPWPPEYAEGLASLSITQRPEPAFAFGTHWVGNRWWYWPSAVVVKWPLPTIVAALLGVVLAVRRRVRSAVLPLVMAVAFAAPVVVQPRDAGVRYLWPALVLAGVAAVAGVAVLRRRWRRTIAAGVVGLQLVALWTSAGRSLAWTPWPFTPAYAVTSDSNVDWGQDYGRLVDWARDKQPYVAYFGALGQGSATVPGARLLPSDPSRITGWVAVSVTALNSTRYHELAWLRRYEPVGSLGGSILIYRFDTPPSQ